MAHHRTLHLQVTHQLRKDITFGALLPGQRLQEETLARHYRVSRTPLREAIRQLENEGLLVEHPPHGVYVPIITLDEVTEFFEARKLLDHHAIQKICKHIPDNDIKKLRHQVVTFKRNCEDYKFVDNYAIIQDFQRILFGNCPNHYIGDAIMAMICRYELLYVLLVKSKKSILYYDALGDLVEAMEHHNTELACTTIKPVLAIHMRTVIEEAPTLFSRTPGGEL